MFNFRKVKPVEEGSKNKNQEDQKNYENKVKELRKACQNFGEYLEEEVNEGTDFSDIIEKFKDEKKGFGKQMKKSWVLSRTSRRLNEMKKNLSKFKNKTFDPQRIGDYVACFKFEREKTKKGNIKRSAIDDEKVFKFFNSTDKDSISRVLNIKRTKAQKNKKLKQAAKTIFDQADKSLVASKKALPEVTGVQTEIEQTLKNIENDQNIDQIAKMDIRNALNKQNGNLQQCIEALQQATNDLEEQQNKTKKVMDDKDYEIYGGKVISLNALYEAIDDNNAAISDLNDTIDDAEEIYSNVENYIEENKKKA